MPKPKLTEAECHLMQQVVEREGHYSLGRTREGAFVAHLAADLGISPDAARGRLRSLEKKGCVSSRAGKTGEPTHWLSLAPGRQAIEFLG